MESDKYRQFNSEQNKIKQELLSELDNFLLNQSNISNQDDRLLARQKALQELDRSIKQDLSLNEIANIIKRDISTTANTEKPVNNAFYSSIHVVDLRPNFEPKLAKKGLFAKLAHKNIKNQASHNDQQENTTIIQPPETVVDADVSLDNITVVTQPAVETTPKPDHLEVRDIKSSINYRLILKKTVLVALSTWLALLPVQGFVFVSQMQKDKDRLLNYSNNGFISLKSGIIKASGNSYQEADIDFNEALDQFSSAKDILNSYDHKFLSLGSSLPVVGDTLKSGENILAISTSLSQAATVLNQKARQETSLTEYIQILNGQLNILIPLLDDTQKRLDKLSGLPENYKNEVEALKKDLPTLLTNLHNLQTITNTLQNLLGSDDEKRYLLLFQNNNELRATGGFIGSYALVDVNKGKIVNMEVPKGGTYDLTAGQKNMWRAPQALTLANPTFNIWDANWWPDFPTSAKKIANLFTESGGTTVDGVVAINATVLQKLLAISGPIYLDDYNYTISTENVYDVLQNEIENKRLENQPKAIISDLAPKVLDKIFSTSQDPEKFLVLLADVLWNKDVQIYVADKNIDQNLSHLGWRREMLDTDRDYLWVVSTNIVGGKTDLAINELIEHEARIESNGEIVDTVTITRSNDGLYDNPWLGLDGGNVSYLRFYVPLGSKLLSADGFDALPESKFYPSEQYKIDPQLAAEESKLIDGPSKTEIFSSLNRTVFANWQTLKPGETKTVTISYKLPFKLSLSDGLTNDWKKIFLASNTQIDHYSMLLQEQSGQSKTIMHSKIILPDNARAIWKVASDENSLMIQDNIIDYRQDLETDQYFGVVMAKK